MIPELHIIPKEKGRKVLIKFTEGEYRALRIFCATQPKPYSWMSYIARAGALMMIGYFNKGRKAKKK